VAQDAIFAHGRHADTEDEYRPNVVSIEHILINCCEKTLIFVEANACAGDYSELVRLLAGKHVVVVFKAKSDYLQLLSIACAALIGAEDRVLYIEGIDPDLDEVIYDSADESADLFLDVFMKRLFRIERYSKFACLMPSLSVAVSDRLVVWYRNFLFLERYISEHGFKRFYTVFNRSPASGFLIPALANQGLTAAGFVVLNARPCNAPLAYENLVKKSFVKINLSKVTRYDFSGVSNAKQVALFVGNLKAPQYREALVPIVESMASLGRRIFVVTPYVEPEVSFGEMISLISPVVVVDDDLFIDEFNAIFDDALEDCISSSIGSIGLSSYIFLCARMALHRVLRDSYRLMLDLDALFLKDKLSALVSIPGRLTLSQFLVGYFDNVPSFEVQSGPWSKSKRFKAPLSKYILANDAFSKSIFVDYLGVSPRKVLVVGSPRIDAKLSAIRQFSRQESMQFVLPYCSGRRILCIATQPYGLQIMQQMVTEVAKFVAANSNEWLLLVNMHPNENDSYEKAYEIILSELISAGNAFIRRGQIYHALNSSDAVVTYFSTSGMEAFCLNKSVYAYRAKDNPEVPFDLCALGVASPFSKASELEYAIERQSTYSSACDLLSLKDGRSVDRICHIICAGDDSRWGG